MIPDASLQVRPSRSTPKKPIVDLLLAPASDTTVAEIWLESKGSPTPPPLRGSQLAGRLRQPNGDTVWVAAHRLTLPWDPYRRYDHIIRTAHAEAIRQHPGWTGDPPLSICLHDPDPELILRELAVPALIPRMVTVYGLGDTAGVHALVTQGHHLLRPLDPKGWTRQLTRSHPGARSGPPDTAVAHITAQRPALASRTSVTAPGGVNLHWKPAISDQTGRALAHGQMLAITQAQCGSSAESAPR